MHPFDIGLAGVGKNYQKLINLNLRNSVPFWLEMSRKKVFQHSVRGCSLDLPIQIFWKIRISGVFRPFLQKSLTIPGWQPAYYKIFEPAPLLSFILPLPGTPPRPSKISMKNCMAKVKPVLTPHLWYKAMLKVWRKSCEPFRIYQLTSTSNPAQFLKLWSDWLC